MTRQYVWNLMEEYHKDGWDMQASSVYMKDEEPDSYGTLGRDEDDEALDEFKIDYLAVLGSIFNVTDEELALQLFFNKEGAPSKVLVLINCLWDMSPDGYEECTAGPFVVAGEDTDQIKYIVPKDLGIPVLSR